MVALLALRMVRALRVLRAARGLRGLRLVRIVGTANRGMNAFRASLGRQGLGYAVLLTVLVALLGAGGMLASEPNPEVEGGFTSYGEALLTSMGSESWPRAAEGRVLCFLLSLYGFAVFGYTTASFASFFVGRDAESAEAEVAGARPRRAAPRGRGLARRTAARPDKGVTGAPPPEPAREGRAQPAAASGSATKRRAPPRSTSSAIPERPAPRAALTASATSPGAATSRSPARRITSPCCKPRFSATLPGSTRATAAPFSPRAASGRGASAKPSVGRPACSFAPCPAIRRLDAARSSPGTGLGLALVRAVADLHGMTVALSDDGPGLRVVVPVPAPARQEGSPP